MKIEKENGQFFFKTYSHSRQILRYLHLGTSIPILPEFCKYIVRNLEAYNATSIVLFEKTSHPRIDKPDESVGHVLVYHEGSLLYFGFFNVYDHDPKKISLLIEKLKEYAKQSGFKTIRGPINVPTTFFGWGFMEGGSDKSLFMGCPVNPPHYIDLFLQNGFKKKFVEDRYKCSILYFDPDNKANPLVQNYNFEEYSYWNPKSKEEMYEVKDELVNLHSKFMPPSAQITPSLNTGFEDLVDYMFEIKVPQALYAVREKKTNHIIACGYVIPNPFSRDEDGNPDSISMHDWVVHPDHRRKGVAVFMYGKTTMASPSGPSYKWGLWPVGEDNTENSNAAKKFGGVLNRSHIIFEITVQNE